MKAVLSSILVTSFLAPLGLCMPSSQENGSILEERQLNPFVTFHSSNATYPRANITKTSTKDLAPGYFVFTPAYDNATPLILAGDGDLIWNAPTDLTGSNLRVQELNGEPILTIFDIYYGYYVTGFLYGSTKFIDKTYNVTMEICPQLGLNIPWASGPVACQGDAHEQFITAEGTLIMPAYNVTQTDLTSIGGSKHGWVVEAQFYEFDIPSGEILFSWKSLKHVPVNQSMWPFDGSGGSAVNAYDYFHINSIQKIGSQYLISSRHCWATYLLSADGHIIWEYNGYNGGDFGPLPSSPTTVNGTLFSWQHDANLHDVTDDSVVLTLFNNDNSSPYEAPIPSSGLSLFLDTKNMTSRLLHDYHNVAQPAYSGEEGSNIILPNGNALISYGNSPTVQEYGPDSDTVPILEMLYGPGPLGGSYRVYKSEWTGLPTTQPSVAIDSNNDYLGYVSWNGATEVTRWKIQYGLTRALDKHFIVHKKGFETSFNLSTQGYYFRAIAYDAQSKVLGRSAVLKYGS